MKMAKKFLAVALAGALALSVLTGCGNSVKSKDIADSLTKMGVKVEQDDGVDKAAEETLAAIEAIIASDTNTAAGEDDKITLDNAVNDTTGKIIEINNIINDPNNAVKKALLPRRQTLPRRSRLLWSISRMPRRTQACRLPL